MLRVSYDLFQIKNVQCLFPSLLQQICSLGIHNLAFLYPAVCCCLLTLPPAPPRHQAPLTLWQAASSLGTLAHKVSSHLLKPYLGSSMNPTSTIISLSLLLSLSLSLSLSANPVKFINFTQVLTIILAPACSSVLVSRSKLVFS